jgi:hypothetical protein
LWRYAAEVLDKHSDEEVGFLQTFNLHRGGSDRQRGEDASADASAENGVGESNAIDLAPPCAEVGHVPVLRP